MGIDIKFLKEQIEEESQDWELDEDYREASRLSNILQSICTCVYLYETEETGLIKEGDGGLEVLNEHQIFLLYEVLKTEIVPSDTKDEVKQNASDKEFQKNFWNRFCKYRDKICETDVHGEHIQKLKDLFISSRTSKTWNSSQFLCQGRLERFFSHYVKSNEILIDSKNLYMNLFAICLYANDYAEFIEYRDILGSYRDVSSTSNTDMIDVLTWSVQCCAELYFEKNIYHNNIELSITLRGIQNFLQNFNFLEVVTKDIWLFRLIQIWEVQDKKSAMKDSVFFMLKFRMYLQNLDIEIAGPLGKAQKDSIYGGESRPVSDDMRPLKKRLEEYFGEELGKRIKYDYFRYNDASVDRTKFSLDERNLYMDSKNCNQLLAAMFLLFNPPKDSFISILEFYLIGEYFLCWIVDNEEVLREMEGEEDLRIMLKRMIRLINTAKKTISNSERIVSSILDCLKKLNMEMDTEQILLEVCLYQFL